MLRLVVECLEASDLPTVEVDTDRPPGVPPLLVRLVHSALRQCLSHSGPKIDDRKMGMLGYRVPVKSRCDHLEVEISQTPVAA
jgi:hypothetical protein